MENPADTSSVVAIANEQIDKKLQSTLDIGSKALSSPEVQAMIQAYGLESYIKNIKQDNVKNVLALAGSWFILSQSKKHWKWVLGSFAALYLYAKSSDTTSTPTNNTIANLTAPKTPLSGYNDSMY